MATDMLTTIETAMYDAIAAAVEGPYFFTWGTINEPDMAKQEFPSAEIQLIEEDNLDIEGGANSGAYQNKANFEIIVKARLGNEVMSGTQVYEIHKELNKALSDLKKIFGVNYNLGGCYVIMYKGMRREFEPMGDLLVPKRMITMWSVWYLQDRSDPTTGADGA